MSYLTAAVVLLGVLCLVNLVLTLKMIRRLGEHSARLAAKSAPVPPPFALGMPDGAMAPEFTATTVNGDRRSLTDFSGAPSLVAFFTPGCVGCRQQLPEFAEFARRFPGGAGHVLAVISGKQDQDETKEFAAGLDGVASVVVEAVSGPVATAFSNKRYPNFYVIGPDGRIQASGPALRMVAQAVAGSVPARA
jgi:peroxiredoxin